MSSTACGYYGNICIQNAEKKAEFTYLEPQDLNFCKKWILAEAVLIIPTKLILSILQYYAICLIFVVARQNE